MRTTEDFIQELESTGAMMSREYTFSEYATELAGFQDVVCKTVAGDEYHEGMRVDDALYIMDSTARKYGLEREPAVTSGVLALRKLSKETAITMSGMIGENVVTKTLAYLERPNTQIYRNVYVTNGQEETELDAIVLTDSGAIILEIKAVKSDFSLTEDGRMVFAGDECYEKMPLGEKMALKRKLLKQSLEKAIFDKGLDIPVQVDSLIVFSAPKGQHIHIDDRYRKETYCFRSCLNKRIEHYLSCICYTAEQVNHIGNVLADMESNVKRFETTVNYNEIRHNIAAAMAVLQEAPGAAEKETIESLKARILELETQLARERRKRKAHTVAGLRYSMASMFAGGLLSAATLIMGTSFRN